MNHEEEAAKKMLNGYLTWLVEHRKSHCMRDAKAYVKAQVQFQTRVWIDKVAYALLKQGKQ